MRIDDAKSKLDTFEEGYLYQDVTVRRNWWKFWQPKKITCAIGLYTRIGNIVSIHIQKLPTFHMCSEEWELNNEK